jgi:hypothetical protein
MKLQDAIKEIDEKCYKEVIKVLCIAHEKRTGNISRGFPYHIDNQLVDLVIDFLADLIIELSSKGKWEKVPIPIEPLIPILTIAEKEIKEVYQQALIPIGFSGSFTAAENDYKDAAVKYFDTNCDHFEAIKRNYLKDDKLYYLIGGQEKRNFTERLFKKIIEDLFSDYHVTIGGRRILEKYRKIRQQQNSV